VIGISCVTDMAIADELEPLTHEQVVAVANSTKPKFIQLVKQIVSDVAL
jgi:purine-nucleoside phosphorylase